MQRVAMNDTAKNRGTLFELLLRANLYVAHAHSQAEFQELEADKSFTLLDIEHEAGTVLPVFTSGERFLEWRPEGGGCLALEGRDFFATVAAEDVVGVAVNPGSQTNGLLARSEIEALARGRLPVAGREWMPAGTRLRVDASTPPLPAGTLLAIRDALDSEPHALEAWLFSIEQEPGKPEHFVAVALVEELDEDAADSAMRSIMQRAGDQAEGAREVSFVPLDELFGEMARSEAGQLIFSR